MIGDELFKYELVRGVLIVNPPPAESQRGPNELLGYRLLDYREHHPQGASLDATIYNEYMRVESGWRIADRAVWAGLGRHPRPPRDVPAIAVDFPSSLTCDRRRDYIDKRREYLEAGVREYWIIDRFRRSMTVCRTGTPDVLVKEQETDRTDLLPGFELPLAVLLEEADRARQGEEDAS
ncbi:MAG: Uma2 family endonuclease [Planctomycetales bacterium]